jgi:hypothetical protein
MPYANAAVPPALVERLPPMVQVPSEGEGAAHSKKTLNLSAHGDLIEAASNLFSHLRALDAAGAVACCWSMIVSESR